MAFLLIANWKQQVREAVAPARYATFARTYAKAPWRKSVVLVVAPPLLALPACAARRTRHLALAAQDVGFTNEGAYTGAIGPAAVRALGVTYAIIGHSERRQWYAEDDLLIRRKCAAALTAGLTVILCVGETKDERQEGKAFAVVTRQIKSSLEAVAVRDHLSRLIIAYEPRWAIGSGVSISPQEAQTMHEQIRSQVGKPVLVCYGGSVSPTNAAAFVRAGGADGLLVGSASTTHTSFFAIAKKLAGVRGTT